jgi:anaerobic ribonucleoside-triphosphate reductase
MKTVYFQKAYRECPACQKPMWFDLDKHFYLCKECGVEEHL